MTESPNSTEPDRLDSWKEIAEYIGRDVRTAIRWERDRRLPIRRVPGARRSAVFAYRDEIDRWLRSRPNLAETSITAPPFDSSETVPSNPAPAPVGGRRSFLGLAGGGVLLVVLAGATVAAVRHVRRVTPAVPRVDRLEPEARGLVARGEDGVVVWRYAMPGRVYSELLVPGVAPWYAIADVDGDGQVEVVATVPISRTGDGNDLQDELYLFTAEGRLLWQTRMQDRATFRGGAFGPPWTAGHIAVYHVGGQSRIAWTQVHHSWWPSLLVVLDGAGRRLGTFVHPGSIRSVRAVEVSGRPLLLLGGINNALRAAFMAVLDGSAVAGHGPAPSGSPYECEGCDAGTPLRYFVFPPSDICLASGMPYNYTRDALWRGSDVEAYTRESVPGAPLAEMVFRFSQDFELLEARSADSWLAHDALEKAGKLDHGVADCPWYRNPPSVREWDPSGRWVDLRPSATSSPHVAPR